MFDMVLNTPQSSVLLTSDHTSTFEPYWLKKRLLDRLKDQIVVTTISGTPDDVTFLETASRILYNFKEDKVSRNALLLLTFSKIILIFSVCIKIISVFSRIWAESQILSIYGQIRIRENPCFDIFHAVFNMISVEYRHVYRIIILTLVRSFFSHILYSLLAVAWYGNFLLLSIN